MTEISDKDRVWAPLDEVEEVRAPHDGFGCAERAMIIVDNALRAREEGRPADPSRDDRRRLHGAGAGEPDRQQRARHGDGRGSPTAARNAPSRSTPTRARDAVVVGNQDGFEDAIRRGEPRVTDDAYLLCRSAQVDVVCDVTAIVEFGAQSSLEAFATASTWSS